MGQHKTNQTAIAAKRGELPPKQKPKRLSKAQQEAWIRELIRDKTGLQQIIEALGGEHYYV